MSRFELSEAARRDLAEIAEYSERQWGRAQTLIYLDGLDDRRAPRVSCPSRDVAQAQSADLRNHGGAHPSQSSGRGVWHHPLIALGQAGDFIVVDRGGEGENLDEVFFEAGEIELLL